MYKEEKAESERHRMLSCQRNRAVGCWGAGQPRTGVRSGQGNRFQTGISPPSLAAGTRPSRGPALSSTPSFTSPDWRWKASGLHSDTHRGVKLSFTHTHMQSHTEEQVLNSALKGLGDGSVSGLPKQERSLAIVSLHTLNCMWRIKYGHLQNGATFDLSLISHLAVCL